MWKCEYLNWLISWGFHVLITWCFNSFQSEFLSFRCSLVLISFLPRHIQISKRSPPPLMMTFLWRIDAFEFLCFFYIFIEFLSLPLICVSGFYQGLWFCNNFLFRFFFPFVLHLLWVPNLKYVNWVSCGILCCRARLRDEMVVWE